MSHIHDTLSNIILQLATLRPCALARVKTHTSILFRYLSGPRLARAQCTTLVSLCSRALRIAVLF